MYHLHSFKRSCPKIRASSFKIIDDDIGLNSLRPSDEAEAMVDLLGPDAPLIVDG